MPGPSFLSGDRVALHVVAEEDHEFLWRHWSDPDVRRGFGAAEPTTAEDIADQVAGFAEKDDQETFLVCATGDGDGPASDPTPVGEAFLFDLDAHRGRVEIGYWIAPPHQGEGYASEGLELLVAYCFEERRLNKVNARVLAFNDASRRVLENAGFRQEGCRREDFFVDGAFVDADLYGITADEWVEGS